MKRMTVLDFAICIAHDSDDIPVTVKDRDKAICFAPSLCRLASRGPVGILEMRISSVTICQDHITIRVK